MIDDSIGIKGIFDNPSIKNWEEITKKMLKTDDLDNKLLFKSIEQIDIYPLHTDNKFVAELATFPTDISIFNDQNQKKNRDEFDIDLCKIHNAGASICQELAYLVHSFINAKKETLNISISLDSLYFSNIAKLRAARFLLERINEESEASTSFNFYAFNSLREQTLFDPWVNMLRNVSSSMSAIIGGANFISSFGYDELFSHLTSQEKSKLGERQSLNHLKILLEESHLSDVKDYSRGSYAIENLTYQFIDKAWSMAKKKPLDNEADFSKEIKEISLKRFELIRKGKSTITGVNNFANPQETIESIYKYKNEVIQNTKSDELYPLRTVASEFENLRSKFNRDNKIAVVLFGDESKLSARANFCQNYFEVLGAEVVQFSSIEKVDKGSHIVICSTDDKYESQLSDFIESAKDKKAKSIYVAGKYEHKDSNGCLYMGQNIYETLHRFVEESC